jgi:hypothetical protein
MQTATLLLPYGQHPHDDQGVTTVQHLSWSTAQVLAWQHRVAALVGSMSAHVPVTLEHTEQPLGYLHSLTPTAAGLSLTLHLTYRGWEQLLLRRSISPVWDCLALGQHAYPYRIRAIGITASPRIPNSYP